MGVYVEKTQIRCFRNRPQLLFARLFRKGENKIWFMKKASRDYRKKKRMEMAFYAPHLKQLREYMVEKLVERICEEVKNRNNQKWIS